MDLGTTGLTVVVGANGSGKSNLVRAVEFTATIARDGLQAALYGQRGTAGIVPRSLDEQGAKDSRTSIVMECSLSRPAWYPQAMPERTVRYELTLAPFGKMAQLVSESFVFSSPLLRQFFQPDPQLSGSTSGESTHGGGNPPSEFFDSLIELKHGPDGAVSIRFDPPLRDYLREYLNWFGMGFFADSITQTSPGDPDAALVALFTQMSGQQSRRSPERGREESWLNQASRPPFLFAGEPDQFRSELAMIRRYDLQLTELRAEQESVASNRLSAQGKGMPSVLRRMREDHESEASLSRLFRTMRAIAPHIRDADVSQLESGKEFVQFYEKTLERPIESWDQSDGSLRALAILLALESQPANGTVLIEEPEQGLHPWAVRTLIAHVREVIRERHIQVLMTTHSQQVLDAVDPSEVVVASWSVSSGTTLRSVRDGA